MLESIDMSFPDVITKLYSIWENSEKQKELLQVELQEYKENIKQLTIGHTELLNNFDSVNEQNKQLINEITQLQKKVQDVEDDQKQFRKVSHIITMDRENNNYKQQIAILEKRVAFYQNQCNNLKGNCPDTLDKQTETENIMIDNETNTQDASTEIVDGNKDIVNDNNITVEENNDTVNDNNITTNEDVDIEVKEKKIKGVVYYVSNDDDIYMKNDDDSIGELKGKIEHLPGGKTKVKWYKTK